MLLTQEADNAVRIVHFLCNTAERKDAAEIANGVGITQRFALKIMHKLVTAGYVRSFKGQKGGYLLAKPPEEITLNDIITAVDGPCLFSKCLDGGRECSDCDCRFRAIYREISDDIERKLKSVRFSDL